MGDVAVLKQKCQDCKGTGRIGYFDSGYATTMIKLCERCEGRGHIWQGHPVSIKMKPKT